MSHAGRSAAALVAAVVLVAACGLGRERDESVSRSESTAPDLSTTESASTPAGGAGQAPPPNTSRVGFNVLPPVRVAEPADFGGGLFAVVTRVQAVELEARGPGETAGAGVVVTLELRNESDETVDLGGIAINASYGDGVPAIRNSSAPGATLSGSLAPGDHRSGVYAFRVPDDEQTSLLIDVHHGGYPNIVLVDVGGDVE